MFIYERTSSEKEANEQATMFVFSSTLTTRSSNKNYANFVRDVREQFYLLENLHANKHLLKIICRSRTSKTECFSVLDYNVNSISGF